MPEMPEVEVTRRRIAPLIEGKMIDRVLVRTPSLRRPVPAEITSVLPGQVILNTGRRGKYLLLYCSGGNVILHLGMSGDVRIAAPGTAPGRHDHLDIILMDGLSLRFNDPRRFGSVLWTVNDPLDHQLLAKLGPEPLSDTFTGHYLFQRSRGRKITVKQFIMDGTVVSGLGNIYTNEALFRAGINPAKEAGSISATCFERLATAVGEVLLAAIEDGMAVVNSYSEVDAVTGYFPVRLSVYGRSGEPCHQCGATIRKIRLGGRSTFFCPKCQR